MKCYVISQETGCYSSAYSAPIRVFTDHAQAEACLARLESWRKAMQAVGEEWASDRVAQRNAWIKAHPNPDDPEAYADEDLHYKLSEAVLESAPRGES